MRIEGKLRNILSDDTIEKKVKILQNIGDIIIKIQKHNFKIFWNLSAMTLI